MNDREIERRRYDERALLVLEGQDEKAFNDGKRTTPPAEKDYLRLLCEVARGARILELGAGMGENTDILVGSAREIVATDISEHSVQVLRKRFGEQRNFTASVEDMGRLSFTNESFDVVCSAGSLSYADNGRVLEEIYRVLKHGGCYVAVDSLNHNPIFRFNRYLHFVRGKRSRSTLARMPTLKLIRQYGLRFGDVQVSFFGAITWLYPLIRQVLTEEQMYTFSAYVDRFFRVRKSAFKFTMRVTKL